MVCCLQTHKFNFILFCNLQYSKIFVNVLTISLHYCFPKCEPNVDISYQSSTTTNRVVCFLKGNVHIVGETASVLVLLSCEDVGPNKVYFGICLGCGLLLNPTRMSFKHHKITLVKREARGWMSLLASSGISGISHSTREA